MPTVKVRIAVAVSEARTATPGPWTYEKEMSSGPHLEKTYLFAHGDVIGRIYSDSQRDNSQANARLIAAAPDLYEALNAIIYGKDWSGIDMARAALQKARGS